MQPLTITGTVEPGIGLAASLGCPTANLALEEGLVIPAMGVYLAYTRIGGDETNYPSVMCVGAGKDTARFKIEVHLLDQKMSLFGQRLTLQIMHKLRDLVPWPGEEMMRGMITDDLEKARSWFSTLFRP